MVDAARGHRHARKHGLSASSASGDGVITSATGVDGSSALATTRLRRSRSVRMPSAAVLAHQQRGHAVSDMVRAASDTGVDGGTDGPAGPGRRAGS